MRLRAVAGEGQTDFVPEGIDKAAGVRALLDDLGHRDPDGQPAFAVGDSKEDLGMLAMAGTGFAPAHAHAELAGSGVRVTGRPYQAGLALAAAKVLGHRPGSCPTCRVPPLGPQSRLLLALLSLRGRQN